MRTIIVAALVLLLTAASSARALSPAAKTFVRKAGLDPASAAGLQADKDGEISSIFRGKPVKNSLEALAAKGSKKGVFAFVTSREFIHKLKADFKRTDIPKTGYDGIYLTNEERNLVVDKLVERAN